MKKIKELNTVVYSFDDLDVVSQARAVSDHIEFWLTCRPYDNENKGNFERALDRAEKIDSSWATSSLIFEYCKHELIDEIREMKGFYSKDGDAILLRETDNGKGELCLNPSILIYVTLINI